MLHSGSEVHPRCGCLHRVKQARFLVWEKLKTSNRPTLRLACPHLHAGHLVSTLLWWTQAWGGGGTLHNNSSVFLNFRSVFLVRKFWQNCRIHVLHRSVSRCSCGLGYVPYLTSLMIYVGGRPQKM